VYQRKVDEGKRDLVCWHFDRPESGSKDGEAEVDVKEMSG
jgi:hypothetical protein